MGRSSTASDVDDEGPARSLSPAVTRAVAIMELIAARPGPLPLSTIARDLGLPKSSVANLCSTLVDEGMLRSTETGFALGQRLARLGAAYLGSVDEVGLFHEACALLRVGAQETAQLAALTDRLEVIYLARREGIHPVRLASTPGRALPSTCTATGKAMLATFDPDIVSAHFAAAEPLPSLTPRSITSVAELLDELAVIRDRGFAIDDEEVVEGVVCVAAALPRRSDAEPLLAVSVTLLSPRATPDLLDELAPEVIEVADSIAAGLGVVVPQRWDR